MSFLLAEPWCLGAPVPIGMPDDRDGNAAPVSPIWAGMGVLRDMTLALYGAYQSCKGYTAVLC